jgi:hypothetical protein
MVSPPTVAADRMRDMAVFGLPGGRDLLVLLCHKFRSLGFGALIRAQHGQRDKLWTMAAASLRRMVAIEVGT